MALFEIGIQKIFGIKICKIVLTMLFEVDK